MALMTCPDCANQYADDAPYCPNCGRPNPARQAGSATGSTGSPPETPAGSTSSTYTAGTGSTGQAGSSGGYTAGGGTAGGTGGYAGGTTGGTGGYGGGGYGGGPAGGGYAAGGPPQQIPNYLVHAILSTLCCCLPLGIVSIIYATQVNSKRDAGDIAGAWEASKNAKKWAMIAAGVGVVWIIIVIAMNGLAFLAALAGGGTTSNY